MKNYQIILLSIIFPFFLSTRINENKTSQTNAIDNWNGTVTWTKTSTSKGKRKWDDHGKEMFTGGISFLNLRLRQPSKMVKALLFAPIKPLRGKKIV